MMLGLCTRLRWREISEKALTIHLLLTLAGIAEPKHATEARKPLLHPGTELGYIRLGSDWCRDDADARRTLLLTATGGMPENLTRRQR